MYAPSIRPSIRATPPLSRLPVKPERAANIHQPRVRGRLEVETNQLRPRGGCRMNRETVLVQKLTRQKHGEVGRYHRHLRRRLYGETRSLQNLRAHARPGATVANRTVPNADLEEFCPIHVVVAGDELGAEPKRLVAHGDRRVEQRDLSVLPEGPRGRSGFRMHPALAGAPRDNGSERGRHFAHRNDEHRVAVRQAEP